MKKAFLLVLLVFFSITLQAVEYAVKVTRNGEALPEEFWISSEELVQAFYSNVSDAAGQGIVFDPYFTNMNIPSEHNMKLIIISYLVDEKLVDYYVLENGLLPSEDEVASETAAMLSMYTSDLYTVGQIEAAYGSIDVFAEEIKEYVTYSLKINRFLDKAIPTDEESLLTYFTENIETIRNLYETVKARHILVSEEATALSLKNKIKNGETTFADAAAQYSEDSSSALNGGELDYLSRGDTVAEFEEAIFTAPVGELYGPVKTMSGYHLIVVEERIEIDSLSDLQASEDTYSDFVERYRDDVYVEWIEAYIDANKFDFEILDSELLFYKSFIDASADRESSLEMIASLATRLFGDGAVESPAPVEYAVFIELSQMLGLTNDPRYEMAIARLYETGEKKGQILQMMYGLKGDDPVVAGDYYNEILQDLERTFSDSAYFYAKQSSYGMDFVDYVLGTIEEIETALGVFLERELSVDTRVYLLSILLRNNSLALDINDDEAWVDKRLNLRLEYLESLMEIDPSEEVEEDIEKIRKMLE
ncbi:MAG: peptidylprolyl isomerase [Mesotoga sp.]|jgi:parvulin-like peptidyl-prolyl isomerase|nr:peptidylprolyl isomerase [Mesotoga sp.]MDD4479329.1 peptidylprolyl isomerase [Mesotoga sp.]HOI63094.1 peptidylprolyl isomerase [Mesotoga sp.]